MDDEKRILMANALRLISASDEDLFFSSTIANDSPTINDGVPLKNPLIVAGDDDNDNEDDSDGANDSSEKFRCSAKRLSRTDEAIGLMSKFSIGHQKVAQKMYSEMTADERVVCAEKLDEFHLNPISVTFDDEFIQQINQKLDAGSVEALRSKKRAQTKGVAGDRKQSRKNSQSTSSAATAIGVTTKELNLYETIDANAMSGIWSMLEANPMKSGFPITTDGYNIFNDKNIEWLNRSNDNVDDARAAAVAVSVACSKCEKWLQKSVKH